MKINKIFIFVLLATLLGSCDDYLDVNKSPNKPTQAEIGKLLTGTQVEIGSAFSGQLSGAPLSSYVFYISSRESDNYSIIPNNTGLGNSWLGAYVYGLKNNDDVIKTADANGFSKYAGISKLTKAYMFAQLVDLFGDVPYSEPFNTSITNPAIDNDKDIYNSLLALIDEAIVQLKAETAGSELVPGKDDLFYGGDLDKWIRMGNTLKLKLLVQSRKAKADIPNWNTQLTALLTQNQFLENGEDFQFEHTKQDTPDERHPVYASEYFGGQSSYQISPWLYETMAGLRLNVTNNPFWGIGDPRIPYFWYNQIKATATTATETDYRDGAFVSLFFGSISSAAGADQRATTSFVGIYPVGGKYDNGQGGRAGKDDGNGAAPDKMLQAYSVPFLLAELYLTGEATGDAKAMLKAGVERSITHVNNVVTGTALPDVPTLEGTAVTEFVNKILTVYDNAASNDEKLRVVMTQKWVANFFNPIEAYSDHRRTGYPTFLPKTQQTALSPYKHSREPVVGPESIPLTGIRDYPRVMWYPSSETTNNKNVTNVGRDVSTKTVFWDK